MPLIRVLQRNRSERFSFGLQSHGVYLSIAGGGKKPLECILSAMSRTWIDCQAKSHDLQKSPQIAQRGVTFFRQSAIQRFSVHVCFFCKMCHTTMGMRHVAQCNQKYAWIFILQSCREICCCFFWIF